jgi:hypothetical protein
MIMKKYIAAKVKSIHYPGFTDLPPMGNARFDLQLFIELNKSVKQLINRPYNGLVPGKCWIQGWYALGFIVTEDIFPGLFLPAAG